MVIWPRSRVLRPVRQSNSTDFPAPVGPAIATYSPSATEKLKFSIASTFGPFEGAKLLRAPSMTTIGPAAALVSFMAVSPLLMCFPAPAQRDAFGGFDDIGHDHRHHDHE